MLFLDQSCEITQFLLPYADELFWQFDKLSTVPGATYVVGREQLRLNSARIQSMSDQCQIVISNPAEGSETIVWHMKRYGVEQSILQGKMLLIGGGRLPSHYPQMLFEHFLTQPLRFEENLQAQQRSKEIFAKKIKPFKFLCLNGRSRPHRRVILAMLESLNLLEQALWTNLDAHLRPIRLLPREYEVDRYNNQSVQGTGFVKHELFNSEWGEIYIKPEPYIDTYFSVVTETIYEYPYSFFTEKIAKPLTIGHPFVAVANRGFYQDLRNLGFQTFDKLIDESFDSIDNGTDRMAKIAAVIDHLCSQDLAAFLQAAEPICKYNQQHLKEFATQHMAELPGRFLRFINYQ